MTELSEAEQAVNDAAGEEFKEETPEEKEMREIRERADQLESDEDITRQEAVAKATEEVKSAPEQYFITGPEGTPIPAPCDVCTTPATFKTDDDGFYCGLHAPSTATVLETAEEATQQGDDTDPVIQWNHPDVDPAEQGKSEDELILERLMANMFDAEEATKFTKALFYGDMGTSKTVGACDTGGLPVLLVAIENGAKSLRNHPSVMRNVKKVMKVKSVSQVEKLAEQLQKGAFPEFEVIVLDTFSELQKMDLDVMVDEGYRQDSSKARWTPEGKMYQGNTEHLRRIAAAFRNVDRHVVFVTHEKEEKDDLSRLFYRPDVTPKVSSTLGSYVDIFVRFTAEIDEEGNPKFYGQCRPTRGVTAKTRIGALPTIIATPTFKIIHEADLTYTAQETEKAS